MGDLYTWLFRRAAEAARAAQERGAELKIEILEAEQHKSEAEVALQLANAAIVRLDRFDPIIGDDHQCPNCWVTDGIRSKIVPIPSDTAVDWFRCVTCHTEISTE